MNSAWSWGRQPWISLAAAATVLALLYLWWWVPFDGPWAPAENPRYVQMYELLPILGGTVAFYGIQPRLDWIDLQSPRPLSSFDTAAAAAVIITFAALPMLTISLWHLGWPPSAFLPEGAGLTTQGELPSYSFFGAFACNIVIILALAALTVSLVGRAIGPLSAIVWFLVLLVLQGHLRWQQLASITLSEQLPTLDTFKIISAVVVLGIGLAAYHKTAAGTRSLIR